MEDNVGVQRGHISWYIVQARRTVLHTTMWLCYVHTDHVVLANACRQHVPDLGEDIGRNTPILAKLKDLLISSTEWKKNIIAISNKVFPLYTEYVTLLPTLPSTLPFTPAASTSTNPVSGLTDVQGLQVKIEMLLPSLDISQPVFNLEDDGLQFLHITTSLTSSPPQSLADLSATELPHTTATTPSSWSYEPPAPWVSVPPPSEHYLNTPFSPAQ